ncbi:MAG: 3-dehydroquinate synthase [Candidatus Omnitrophica bacterium]|nr:3-dehydroquinate synthase [Candidatus Omnitrophota bacterium]
MMSKKKMKIINLRLSENPYNIYLGQGAFNQIDQYVRKNNIGNLGIVVTSRKVFKLYQPLIESALPKKKGYSIVTVCDGEPAKSKEWLFKIISQIIKYDLWNKKPFIVCLGGGTVGDLGGFAASIYKRGIPCIQVPTTLLAQVDSSVGGKTAIDLKQAKNIIGSFYQPKAVFVDTNFLATLPRKEVREGLAEVIKYGVIADKDLFYLLRDKVDDVLNLDKAVISKIVYTCLKIKAKIVQADEKESLGIRTILNFGHSFGHALEASLGYSKLTHGKAVSIGMVYAGYLSYLLGKTSKQTVLEISKLALKLGLPIIVKFDSDKVYQAMTYDKKFISGKARMVLLEKIGQVSVGSNLPLTMIKKAIINLEAFIDKQLKL